MTPYSTTIVICFYFHSGVQKATIRIGSTQAGHGTAYYSSQLIIHPQFDEYTKDYDIGLIEVSEEMYLDGINAIAVRLANSGTVVEPGTNILIAGWGDTRVRFTVPLL